jgi:hypothetical protein
VRRFAFLIILIFLSTLAASSQIPKRATVFGGYTRLRIGDGGIVSCCGYNYGLNGWNASFEGKIARLIGVVADFGQQYGTPVNSSMGSSTLVVHEHQTTALFGPQISIPVPRVRPFAHALFGVDHFSDHAVSNAPASVTISSNHFAVALGGGIDVKLSRRIWIRAVQMEWVRVSRPGGGFNEVRTSAGIAIHL